MTWHIFTDCFKLIIVGFDTHTFYCFMTKGLSHLSVIGWPIPGPRPVGVEAARPVAFFNGLWLIWVVFGIGGWVAVCGRRWFLWGGGKWGQKDPKTVLAEGTVGMGMRSALGGSPLGWLDLGGPKDVRGYAGCPLGGPDWKIWAGNAKSVRSIVNHFLGFCVLFVGTFEGVKMSKTRKNPKFR